RGCSLAERLDNAFRDLFAHGYERVALLAGDCPTLDPGDVRLALTELATADIGLTPAHDGGYGLIALRAPHPELFEGVAMGTDQVLEQTLERAQAAGLRVRLLPTVRDLDTAQDLDQANQRGELRW